MMYLLSGRFVGFGSGPVGGPPSEKNGHGSWSGPWPSGMGLLLGRTPMHGRVYGGGGMARRRLGSGGMARAGYPQDVDRGHGFRG